jgi:hypothetical protein
MTDRATVFNATLQIRLPGLINLLMISPVTIPVARSHSG